MVLNMHQEFTIIFQKKVKNKTLKRILNSDVAHLALNKAIKTDNNRLDG